MVSVVARDRENRIHSLPIANRTVRRVSQLLRAHQIVNTIITAIPMLATFDATVSNPAKTSKLPMKLLPR